MYIDQLIDQNPLTVASDSLLSDAIALISQKHKSSHGDCILVVAATRLIGILTSADAMRLIATEIDLTKTTVAKVMTQPEITLRRSALQERILGSQGYDIQAVWSLMEQHSVSCIPIVEEEGELFGIISHHSLLKSLEAVDGQLEHQYRQTKLLAEITRKIRMSINLREILQTAVTEVQHLLACDRVLIVELRSNDTAVPISESILPSLPSMLGYELADPLLSGRYLARYRQGDNLAINDLATELICPDVKQLLKQFKVKAKLVVPILSQHQLKGLLVAHQCDHPRRWQEEEIQLLNQLADQIGVALSQAQLLNNLEELVSKRTTELTTTNQVLQAEIAERKQTEAALRENQQKLTGILEMIASYLSTLYVKDIKKENPGNLTIVGYDPTVKLNI